MSRPSDPNEQREFRCNHCGGRVPVAVTLSSKNRPGLVPSRGGRSQVPMLLVTLMLIFGVGAIELPNDIGMHVDSQSISGAGATVESGDGDSLRNAWRHVVVSVLRSDIASTSPEEKAPCLLGGKAVREKLSDFHASCMPFPATRLRHQSWIGTSSPRPSADSYVGSSQASAVRMPRSPRIDRDG